MDIRPLHSEDDYRAALTEVSALVDLDPEPGTPDGDRLEILSTLVERYETAHFPFDVTVREASAEGKADETWNYRVIELRENGETWRGFHEVYYTDGVPHSYTERPVAVAWLIEEGESDGGQMMMQRLQEALSKPVLTPVDFRQPAISDAASEPARRLADLGGTQRGIEGASRRRQARVEGESDKRGDWLSLADALAQPGEADLEFDAPRIPAATKIITLGIDSERAVTTRFAAAMKGEAQGSFITFASPELLFQTLTQLRWSIVKAVTGAGPLSLRDVAQRVGRDVEAVHDDVRALLDTGVLERAPEGAIVFPYDAVHVDFTLTATHNSPEASR